MHYKWPIDVSTHILLILRFAGGENDRYHLHSKYGINDAGILINP